MTPQFFNAPTQALIRAVSPIVGILLILLGTAALCGGGTDAYFPTMKVPTAWCFILLGTATIALRHATDRVGSCAARVIGALLLLLAASIVFDSGASALGANGIAPTSAWAFYFFGLSLFFIPSQSERFLWVGQTLLLVSASVGVYEGMIYYFDVKTTSFTNARMAVATAGPILMAALGLFCVCPDRGLALILQRQTAGGMMARRFLPWVFLMPLLMWTVGVLSQDLEVVSQVQGFALFFTGTFIYLIATITTTAVRLHVMDTRQKEATSLFDSIIENIPNMIFLKDAQDLRFRLFNRAGEALLGYSRKDLLGKNDYDFFPKEQADFFTQKDREILKQTLPVDIPQEPIDTKNGQRILHTKKITVKNELGEPRYLLGISEDITQHIKHELQLEEQRKMLIQTSKMSALGEMASGIAHEINNPLSVVYGEAEGLRDLATSETLNFEEVARVAAKIEATTERIARIVKGLRAFARDSSEEPFLTVNLHEVIEDTLAFCRERFQTHGTSLTVVPIPNTLEIECRRIQLSQVILNLLNNAFDALSAQKDRQIRVEWKDCGDELELSVSDNGPGVPEKIRDKVFQPFFSTKDVGKGTGLGLSIAKGIVEAHRGTLTVESPSPGTGAVFKIRIPRLQNPVESKAAA